MKSLLTRIGLAVCAAMLMIPMSLAGQAAADGSPPIPHSQPPGGGGPPGSTVDSAHDECGRYALLRLGSLKNNYTKMYVKHNITNPGVWRFAVRDSCGSASGGSSRVYLAGVVRCRMVGGLCYIIDTRQVRLVQDFRKSGFGDGKQFGAVTMYCTGYTLCPDWVSTAVNASPPADASTGETFVFLRSHNRRQ